MRPTPGAEPLTVVVPARDEAVTIAGVIRQLLPQPWVGEVIVVDNGSADATAAVAQAAGARTVFEERPGMGHALRAGLAAARYDWVMKVDADLDRFDMSRFAAMAEARRPGVGLVKGNWQDPADNMPMTRLLVKPALARLAPGLRGLKGPNSGIYVVDRTRIAHQEIVGSYAADLDVMLRVHASGAEVAEVDIGQISHDSRDLGHYNAMAETIMAFFIERSTGCGARETVIMANDAGEVTGTSMGLLAARARAGALVHVFLDEADTPQADILRHVMAPFPTVAIRPMVEAQEFCPEGPQGDVQIIASYPSAEKAGVVRTALTLHAGLEGAGRASRDLLMMPPLSRLDMVHHFLPDYAFDVESGAGIRAEALQRMREAGHDLLRDASAAPREAFQSYASLPGAVKLDLSPEKLRAEAVGPA